MIKNLFNQKKASSNKRGSMLTLVLVILAMALILITSAITITSSTRGRYVDNTLSSQARATATSVAETLCTAIMNQDVLDSELEAMATGSVTVTAKATGSNVPAGLRGVAETSTTLSFSKDSNYIYMDVITTIGKDSSDNPVVESVRVYLKKKDPPARSTLFNNLMEVGDNCSFAKFEVGDGAPAGAANTVFSHGNSELCLSQSGNTIKSDIIFTGPTTFGNGGSYSNIIFASDDTHNAWITAKNGNISASNVGFFGLGSSKADLVGPGASWNTSSDCADVTIGNVIFNNMNVNGYFRGVSNFYDLGANSSVAGGLADNGKSNMDNSISNNASNTALEDKAKELLIRAQNALKAENAFPTLAEAEPHFLDGVTATTHHGTINGSVDKTFNQPGYYTLPSTISATLTFDLSVAGGYVLVVESETVITSTGLIKFINGNPSSAQMGNWGRIIIEDGATLTIGSASDSAASGWHGVVVPSCHDGDNNRAPKANTKPTCFIYGKANSTLNVKAGDHYNVDAYIGLYGDNSTLNLEHLQYFTGRVSATNFKSTDANGSVLPYSPGPHEDGGTNQKVPKVSEYEIVRFRYYYGTI